MVDAVEHYRGFSLSAIQPPGPLWQGHAHPESWAVPWSPRWPAVTGASREAVLKTMRKQIDEFLDGTGPQPAKRAAAPVGTH